MNDVRPDEMELPAAAATSRARVAVVLLIVVAGAFGVGYLQHRKHADAPMLAAGPSGSAAAIRVEVVKPQAQQTDQALALPGVARALEETKIYPRISGYVRHFLVDIGDKVKAGQVLAEIDSPEIQGQLLQARALLAQARAAVKQAVAQRDFARASSTRYSSLADQKLVSKSAAEQQEATAATDEALVVAAESNVVAQEANVRRLADQLAFAKVTAPFAGTITTRTIATGALVGETGAAASAMFTLVATDPVRVFVDVPQTVAPSVRPGIAAVVTVREYAGRKFTGTVTRAAGALDPELHTMTTEIQVPNGDGALLPGMYVQAALTLPAPHRVLELPATALYNDALGLRVAVVDAHHRVHFAKITIERDTGATILVATGITDDDRIVKIAVPTLADGDLVETAP